MKVFLTERDIEALWASGERRLTVGADTRLTDAARERAHALGLAVEAAGTRAGLDPVVMLAGGGPFDLLIRNARLVIPGFGVMEAGLGIRDGRVAALSAAGGEEAVRIVDAGGRYVLPGVIDPHVHLGLFAGLDEEVGTELRSALAGGVTTAGVFMGGAGSHRETISRFRRLVPSLTDTDVFLHATIATREQLEEIDAYIAQGVTSFKFYLCGIPGLIEEVSDDFLLEGFSRIAARPGCMAVIHAENAPAVRWQTARREQEGIRTLQDWADTRPGWTEAEAVARAARFATATGAKVYFVHLSSREGLEAARQAKAEYGGIQVETTSPYLALGSDTEGLGAVGKMVPPLRERIHRDSLWRGCIDGTVDTIGTDNVTMTGAEKSLSAGIAGAMPGYPALATHLSSLLSEGIWQRGLPITRLAELTSLNPARIFGLFPRKGTLLPGSDADLVIVDIDREKTVRAAELHSRSDISLFAGRRLRGWPMMTIKGGRVVMEDGCYLGSGSGGAVIERKATGGIQR